MARHIRRVENYTNAALLMGLVNLLWILTVIWVNWGLVALVLTTVCLNHLITLLDRHLHARDEIGKTPPGDAPPPAAPPSG